MKPPTNPVTPRAQTGMSAPAATRLFLGRTIFRYGLAIVSVALALAIGLALEHFKFRSGLVPPFLFAVAVSAWYGGGRAAVLALLLACFSFDYFFVEPVYTLYIAPSELPYFIVFSLFAAMVTWFSRVRRRVEQDLRESRNQLEQEVTVRTQQANLLNLTHDMIFVRDMDAVITYWNRGAEELYGFTEEEAIGKRSHDLLRTVFPAALEDIQAQVVRTGRWEGELRHTKADGTEVIVLSRWSLRPAEQGRPAAIMETNTDITRRKRGEEEIRTLNEELGKRALELETTNKELEAFAYSVSHDLRAPVRHIAGFTELLQKHSGSVLDDKGRHHISMILDSANRMGTLVDDLLAFSRIGRTQTKNVTVDLSQMVKGVIGEFAPETRGRKILWRVGDLPKCYGDPAMLRVVFTNLVSNALKFTRTREQAEIEIDSLNHSPAEIIVFVKDNGVGFDMRYKDKLFGVFQRLHPQEAFEGTGIGLATVQRIIHRHHGKVWPDSSVDHGATFYVALPKLEKGPV